MTAAPLGKPGPEAEGPRALGWVASLGLVLENLLWHWFPAAVAMWSGQVAALVAVLVFALGNGVATLAWERRKLGPKDGTYWRLHGWMKFVRVVNLGVQGFAVWSAYHVSPWAIRACTLVVTAMIVVGVVRPDLPSLGRIVTHPVHALSLAILVVLALNVGAYAGLAGRSCEEVLAQPGLTPLLLGEESEAKGDRAALYDEDCPLARTVSVGEDGILFVACGPDPPVGEIDAVVRIDGTRPAERRALRDSSAMMALPVPGTDRLVVSVFGRNRVRIVNRDTLAPLAELSVERPLVLGWDQPSRRVLVGVQDGHGCLLGVDPESGQALPRSRAPLPAVKSDQKSLACLPTNCSPAWFAPLPAVGRIVLGNYVGTCSWQIADYTGLFRVSATERLFPVRDVARSPSSREVGLAMAFVGKLIVLDATTLQVAREVPIGVGGMFFDWVDDRTVAVGNYVNGQLRLVDSITGRSGDPMEMGAKLREVTVDRPRNRVLTASRCGVFSVDLARLVAPLGGEAATRPGEPRGRSSAR